MFESVLRVKHVNFKNCFAYLSPTHMHLNTGICIKITYGDREAYFSASIIRNTVDDESIGINASYANLLGINESDFVNVQQVEQLPVVNSISVQPFTKSDYDVLEILSQNVQSNLLDQVRVVHSRQKLLIWIGSSLSVPVIVENVQPIAPGVLDFLTEVIIKPPDNFPVDVPKGGINGQDEISQRNEQFLNFLNRTSGKGPSLYNQFDNILNFHRDLCHRLLPLSALAPTILRKCDRLHPFMVFALKDKTDCDKYQFYSINLLNSPYSDKKLFVNLFFLEDFFDVPDAVFLANNKDNVFVDDAVFSFLQTDVGARVLLKKVTTRPPLVKKIEIHSNKNYLINVVEKLKIYLADHCQPPLMWNPNFPLEIDKELYCSLKFEPDSSEYCIIDEDFLRNCSYSLCDEPVRPLEGPPKLCESEKKFCMEIAIANDACDNIDSVLFNRNIYQPENIIICGKAGVGKSSLLNFIATKLSVYPYFIYTETVHCKKIKGKTVDSLHKLFGDIIAKLIFCQPSLLILDDLHVLCERCEGEETPNTVYFNRVSEMLHGLFIASLKGNSIGILATTDSVPKLNKHIYRSKGNHLFKNVFTMGNLSKADRILLLKHFFKQHSVDDNVDYDELSIKSDGFVVQDIEDFYHKSLFEAYKDPRNNGQDPKIFQEHCDIALKKSCALSLQNVKFHSAESKSFDDIGGLHNVKNTLIESLLWPVKYSTIFANAPLRLQSGILLYGPPGTGKTLLAGAAAKQCSLRLISIKGPELLSKYIGASEQAVRDVFEKAQMAKPCILFFDEFDSLAPRRGHDNTGVTDRVVNQLLTQLDGVEALTGVCVLAATSRPDLLDPALLRPGRLDKQLFCAMPNQNDRLEILQTLSNKLELSDDVNFAEIAIKTEGYTGADLQSVLYTAQISSMNNIDHEGEIEIIQTKVSQIVLLEALGTTRPSLTKSEKAKYDRIYTKFQGGNMEDFLAGSKVTLA